MDREPFPYQGSLAMHQSAAGSYHRGLALEPFRYEPWVYGFTCVIAIIFAWAMMPVPRALEAQRNIMAAERLMDDGEYQEALKTNLAVMKIYPGSSSLKIATATCYFASHTADGDKAGLAILKGLDLTESDMEKLQNTMPGNYAKKFFVQDDDYWRVANPQQVRSSGDTKPRPKSQPARKIKNKRARGD